MFVIFYFTLSLNIIDWCACVTCTCKDVLNLGGETMKISSDAEVFVWGVCN